MQGQRIHAGKGVQCNEYSPPLQHFIFDFGFFFIPESVLRCGIIMLLEILFLLVVPYFFSGRYMIQRHGVAAIEQLRVMVRYNNTENKKERGNEGKKRRRNMEADPENKKEAKRFTTAGLGEQWRDSDSS